MISKTDSQRGSQNEQGKKKRVSWEQPIVKESVFTKKEVIVPCNDYYKNYFEKIQTECYAQLAVANKAKSKGFDISERVETVPAVDLADRAETIIGLKGLAKRYREVFLEVGDRRKAYFQIFKEILDQKWCAIPDLSKRVEMGVKACLLIETEGVVVAPLDGVPKVEVALNPDGSKYIDIYFAGPIRAAGGSSTVIPLILGDMARVHLGLDKYKPTNDEIERYVEEISIYQSEIISRQNVMTDKEVRLVVENCPVCVNGVPTEEIEVSVHRDLPRVPSNRIRGAVCLILTEGVSLKALWVMDTARKYGLDWSFLEQIVKVEKKQSTIEIKPNKKILDGLAAGRPILAYPSTWGGFRLRYGRGRNTGIMAKAINPSSMIMFDEFIAVGTHGKIERPGKATQFFPCNNIDGPIVLLKDDSVVRVNTQEHAKVIKPFVKKILFIGDLLCTYGDFRKSAHPLIPPGYCEEWFSLELSKKILEKQINEKNLKKKLIEIGFEEKLVEKLLLLGEKNTNNENEKDSKTKTSLIFSNALKIVNNLTEKEALALSKVLDVSLHPKYLHYYKGLSLEQTKFLREKLLASEIVFSENKDFVEVLGKKVVTKILLNNESEVKVLLQKIGLPHIVSGEKIVIEDFALSFAETFALNKEKKLDKKDGVKLGELKPTTINYLSSISGLSIRDKAGSFIGGRMGRPEQAKPRQMKGNPHVLFPIGLAGGNTRNILKAISEEANPKGKVNTEIAQFKCPKCNTISVYQHCSDCNVRTKKLSYCTQCNVLVEGSHCYKCGNETREAGYHEINVRELFDNARKNLRITSEDTVKGIKGLISEMKEVEPLEKGLLRARHNIHIFRDATSRFELLNATITHFKPIEIGLSVEKARELGYLKDVYGKELENEEQMLEIYPQDIIVNETCGDWMVNVSKFIDDLLERFYKVDKFYNAETKEDLIGVIVLGLAPHTSAGVAARVIGYSKARVGFGHPYFICAKRRNCLPADEQVLLEKNGQVVLEKIGDLFDEKYKEFSPLEKFNAFTIDSKGSVNKQIVSGVMRQKAPKEILYFKTKTGRRVRTTKDHKLMILEEKSGLKRVVEKKADLLKKGDLLLSLNSKIDFEKNNSINVFDYYKTLPLNEKKKLRVHNSTIKKKVSLYGYNALAKKIGWSSGKAIHVAISFDAIPFDLFEKIIDELQLSSKELVSEKLFWISYAKQKSRIPCVVPLNRDLGELFGLYLSDGYSRTTDNGLRKKYVYQINIVSDEKEITSKITSTIKKTFEHKVTIEKRIIKKKEGALEKRKYLEYITLSGRVYYDFFTKIIALGTNAKNKKLSEKIFNSNKEFLEGLIAGYIVGDGYIDNNSIKITSVNKQLLNGMGFVLNQLGAFPHFGEEQREIKTGRVKEFYSKKNKKIFIHSYFIRLYSTDLKNIGSLLFGRKKNIFNKIFSWLKIRGKRTKKIGAFIIDEIVEVNLEKFSGEYVYDLLVEGEKNFIGGLGCLALYDCDGDQDSVMLLMDALLNFSHKYLSHKSGGRMDAPLVFTTTINPIEIDNEVHEMETCWNYNLDFYEKATKIVDHSAVDVEYVKKRLGKEEQYYGLGYTHETSFFDEGPKMSKYVQLKTMDEKIQLQNALQKRIAAVDPKDALERVMGSHFLPDIIGNARAFSRQNFRCTNCNEKYRRIPLSGHCYKCGKENLVLTIHQGSVIKYLKIAQNLAKQESLSPYLIQRLDMVEKEINSIFGDSPDLGKEKELLKQKSLFEFV